MNGIHCAFEGTLGQDAELRYTQNARAVLNFSVAVSENRAGGDGYLFWDGTGCWVCEACGTLTGYAVQDDRPTGFAAGGA